MSLLALGEMNLAQSQHKLGSELSHYASNTAS